MHTLVHDRAAKTIRRGAARVSSPRYRWLPVALFQAFASNPPTINSSDRDNVSRAPGCFHSGVRHFNALFGSVVFARRASCNGNFCFTLWGKSVYGVIDAAAAPASPSKNSSTTVERSAFRRPIRQVHKCVTISFADKGTLGQIVEGRPSDRNHFERPAQSFDASRVIKGLFTFGRAREKRLCSGIPSGRELRSVPTCDSPHLLHISAKEYQAITVGRKDCT